MTATGRLEVIDEPNLSVAWSRVFLQLVARSGEEVAPLVVSVTGFDDGVPFEDDAVRKALDTCLESNKLQPVQTVANTIFPQSLWQMAKGDRKQLYELYLENLPSYVAMAPNKNRRGLYFARLIAYHTDPRNGKRLPYIPSDTVPADGNQLEFIIENCKPGKRRSMFQASIFDPLRDHTRAGQLGFPCLQHVAFIPNSSDDTLMLNAFYATQQAFERAYGNYLGLCRLGAFVAHEAGLKFTRMTCFSGIEKMEKRPAASDPSWVVLKSITATVAQAATAERN